MAARGIFRPSSQKTDRGDGLAADPLAVDSSSVVADAAGPSNAPSTHAAAAIAEHRLDTVAALAASIAATGTAPIDRPEAIGQEQTELPDLTAPAAPAVPQASRADGVEGAPGVLAGSEANATAATEDRRDGHRLALRIAAYSAVSLMVSEAVRARFGRPAPRPG